MPKRKVHEGGMDRANALANAALLERTSFDQEALADGVEALQAAVRRRLARKTALCWGETCGDGLRTGAEECDDTNNIANDGCCVDCKIERGWECSGTQCEQSVCTERCGNGLRSSGEECDDDNTNSEDCRPAGKTALCWGEDAPVRMHRASSPVPLGGVAHGANADHAINARHEVKQVLPKQDLSGKGSKLGVVSKLGAAGNTSPRINPEPEPLGAPRGLAPGEQLGYSDATLDCAPVFVFINGLFDGGVAGPVRKHLRRTFPSCAFLSLHCGAVSSVWDRAVECFWELRGGRVDYQVDGSVLEHGHGRYGESHPGLLPSWCADRPIHIFAFSLGATTARCLQHLLERGVFADKNGPISTSGAWIKTIVTLHGANSGSLAVHCIGLCPWSLTPLPFSILWWIFNVIYCIVWLDIDRLNQCSGLRLSHWKAQRRKSWEDSEGVTLARLLWWRPGASDNAGRDLAPGRMEEINSIFAQTLPHPSTRYIAAYGSVFAPARRDAREAGGWRYYGLHLPCRSLWRRFPFVLFLLPFGVMQTLAGLLSRLLRQFAVAIQEAANGVEDNPRGEDVKAGMREEAETHREHAAEQAPGDEAAAVSSGRDNGGARSNMTVLEVSNMFEQSLQQQRSDARIRVSIVTAPCAQKAEKKVKAKPWQPNRADWRVHQPANYESSLGGKCKAQPCVGDSPLRWVMRHVIGARGHAIKMSHCVPTPGSISLERKGEASASHAGLWNDGEANDGVLSVAAQKAPATERREETSDFESVAGLLAAQREHGAAVVVPVGAWTQVFAGWHDHIEMMEDGEDQRALMQDLCSLICESG